MSPPLPGRLAPDDLTLLTRRWFDSLWGTLGRARDL
jgi:hypothetical protein